MWQHPGSENVSTDTDCSAIRWQAEEGMCVCLLAHTFHLTGHLLRAPGG